MKTNNKEKFINVPMKKEAFDEFENKIKVLREFFKNTSTKVDKASIIRILLDKFIKTPSLVYKELKNK